MSRQAFSTVHISPEQERAVRLLYETFNQAKSPDRRILVAALAEAFMNGMTTQEQLFLNSCQTGLCMTPETASASRTTCPGGHISYG